MTSMKMRLTFKFGGYLFVFLLLGAFLLLPAKHAHAWGHYMGAHGGMATADESEPGTHFGGLHVSRTEVSGNGFIWESETHSYIKFITGYDMEHNPLPWAGGGENLNEALVVLRGYVTSGTAPLTVQIYHINDDSWDYRDLTYATSPLANGATATLLDTQIVSGDGVYQSELITWDLLASGAYLDIWNTQDKLDHTISLMFRLLGGELGSVTLHEDSMFIALTLEGTANPVPVPAAVWLLSSGLIGLLGFRRKFSK